MESHYEFELIEEYFLNGEHRFRLKDKKSGLILNVSAENVDEAASKATKILSNITSSEQSIKD